MSGWKAQYWKARERAAASLGHVRSRLRPFTIPVAQRWNRGQYAIDLAARVGFFAQLNWLVYILRHCEQSERRPRLRFSSPWYTDPQQGPNWLAYHFLPRQPSLWLDADVEGPAPRVSRAVYLEDLGLPASARSGLSLEEACAVLARHVDIHPEVGGLVESFVARHFQPGATLGVHFRSTDKGSEARLLTADEMLACIRRQLTACPHYRCVYVASDDARFVERALGELDGVPVIVREDELRSTDGRAVHTRAESSENLRKGREALVNCLLLARCDGLLRTASFLSGWASVFNPALPVTLLNPPYAEASWFPDRLVAQRSLPVP
jgi:hypothetical protein